MKQNVLTIIAIVGLIAAPFIIAALIVVCAGIGVIWSLAEPMHNPSDN